VDRVSCGAFTVSDWDLLKQAYLRIGLNEDGTIRPGSLFELHGKLHEGVCSGAVDIHKSGGPFLIWHRAFLFFHERALNHSLLEDGTIDTDILRLPYWEWDSVPGDFISVPQQYTEPGGVLYRKRPYKPVNANKAKGPALQNMLGQANFVDGQNAIGSPHRDIHLAFFPEMMGDLMKSAFDPLFYVHHSEVDRLFEKWKLLHTGAWPTIADTASFYDQEGRLGCYCLGDFMNIARLGYRNDWYPDIEIDGADEAKIVLVLDGLTDPTPHDWAFVADNQPGLGGLSPTAPLIGYGAPPIGMAMTKMSAKLPVGTTLAFLLQTAAPKSVWAATINEKGEVIRVDEVKNFVVEKNLP